MRTFGVQGSGDGELDYPQGVAVDGEGRIWVADTCNNRIEVFGPDGILLMKFGGRGSEDGMFSLPTDVAVGADGRIAVVDTGNNRIQIFECIEG
uniref:SMP-30/Gluconolactonase/LRE-like region domain-containing protein n=1 Tax=Arcella intermedia TaxID=1963864 RepID=A0A6B2LSP1_9EUKA